MFHTDIPTKPFRPDLKTLKVLSSFRFEPLLHVPRSVGKEGDSTQMVQRPPGVQVGKLACTPNRLSPKSFGSAWFWVSDFRFGLIIPRAIRLGCDDAWHKVYSTRF